MKTFWYNCRCDIELFYTIIIRHFVLSSPSYVFYKWIKKLRWHNPANICWSWRRRQDVFSVTILRLQRRLAKTFWRRLGRRKIFPLKTSWRHVLKTSWRHVFKMSWRHILKTSWRHYGEKQNTYWGSNKSKCVSNKSIFHKSISDNSKVNPKCIN